MQIDQIEIDQQPGTVQLPKYATTHHNSQRMLLIQTKLIHETQSDNDDLHRNDRLRRKENARSYETRTREHNPNSQIAPLGTNLSTHKTTYEMRL